MFLTEWSAEFCNELYIVTLCLEIICLSETFSPTDESTLRHKPYHHLHPHRHKTTKKFVCFFCLSALSFFLHSFHLILFLPLFCISFHSQSISTFRLLFSLFFPLILPFSMCLLFVVSFPPLFCAVSCAACRNFQFSGLLWSASLVEGPEVPERD